jgi:hypothetical protein
MVALRPYRVSAIVLVASQSPQVVLAAQGRAAASTIPGIEGIKLGLASVRIANPCDESTRCEMAKARL